MVRSRCARIGSLLAWVTSSLGPLIMSPGLLLVPACQGASSDIGLDAKMRVAGAQFATGDVELAPANGPAVVSVFNSLSTVQPGQREKPLTGALDPGAVAVVLGLRGDRGHWIVVAGPPALDAPDLPTFHATLSFSPYLEPGAQTLLVRAVNARGDFGQVVEVALASVPAPSPAGALVVRLSWDTEADLDLHVVLPDGVEIWARNINSYQAPPPGMPADASAWQGGGILDFDSNAGCVIDGRRQENVAWQLLPAAGRYQVRVDAASLCGATTARWMVEAISNGDVIAASQGESIPNDVRYSTGPGSGAQALAFDVPAP